MEETFLPQSALKTPADYKAAVEQLLAEMKRLNERMQSDRADIERLRLETQALKVETQRLKAETRATLASLGVAL